MTMGKQWAIVGGVVATLALGLFAATRVMSDQLFPVEQGTKAPEFRAKVLGEDRYKTIADYKGKVVLLNIWATYCEPCKWEMPSLQRLYQAYGDKGLNIVAVSVDHAVGEDSIRAFAKQYGITFEVLHDKLSDIERQYQATGYPETFVIDSEGVIRKKWIGPDDWNSRGNRALVAQLLGLETPRVVSDTAGSSR